MRRLLRALLVGLLMLLPMVAGAAEPDAAWAAGWEKATGGKMVGAASAAKLMQAGARVLDTRSSSAFEAGHLPGAVWMAPDRLLAAQSGELVLVPQLDAPQGVLVVGKMGGGGWWGEQGWLGMVLSSAGAAEVTVAMVEPAAVAASAGVSLEVGGSPEPSWLRLVEPASVRAGVMSLAEASAAQQSVAARFLDVRTRAEFEGARFFGEARGGHIPGAELLAWNALQGEPGWPLEAAAWRSRVEAALAGSTVPVAVYCTGGIRSGFVTFALRAMGVEARNFEGSMWAWSAEPTLPMESGPLGERDGDKAR
jgi:thiosulfate/3-mercaptopyruvate sulfurtransferase